MWIVKLALARPYTFIVLSLVLLLICPVVLLRTPVDIFPSINIPVALRDGNSHRVDFRAIVDHVGKQR
jgi:hypothetical protein